MPDKKPIKTMEDAMSQGPKGKQKGSVQCFKCKRQVRVVQVDKQGRCPNCQEKES